MSEGGKKPDSSQSLDRINGIFDSIKNLVIFAPQSPEEFNFHFQKLEKSIEGEIKHQFPKEFEKKEVNIVRHIKSVPQ